MSKTGRRVIVAILTGLLFGATVLIGSTRIRKNENEKPKIINETETKEITQIETKESEDLSEIYNLFLVGEKTIYIKVEEEFEDPGIQIYNGNGDRCIDLENSDKLSIDSKEVDIHTEGIYYIRYNFRNMHILRKVVVSGK